MHEGIVEGYQYGLGKRSRDKQAGQTLKIGIHFLRRSFDAVTKRSMERLKRAMQAVI